MTSPPEGSTRFDRRRAQTRASLIAAAQAFLAEGRPSVPINEVTDRADVGIGSFYNHFASKDDLFEAAVTDALERYGVLLDTLGGDLADPSPDEREQLRSVGLAAVPKYDWSVLLPELLSVYELVANR